MGLEISAAYGNVPCPGDFGRARDGSSGCSVVPATIPPDFGAIRTHDHRGGRLAVRVGLGIFGPGGSSGWRIYVVPHRPRLLSPWTGAESAGRRRSGLSGLGPGATLRRELPALVSLGGRHRSAGRAHARSDLGCAGARASGQDRASPSSTRIWNLAPAQFRQVEVRLAAEMLSLWTRVPARWLQESLAAVLRLVLFAFEMVVISATIQIGLVLPMAEYFHRVSFTGLSANLLIVPALNCVVPLGFAAIFTGWHWPAVVAEVLLRFSARVKLRAQAVVLELLLGECRILRCGWRSRSRRH